MQNNTISIEITNKIFVQEIGKIPTNSSFQDFVKSVDEALSKWQSSYGIQQELQLRFIDFFSSARDGDSATKRVPIELESFCLTKIEEMFQKYQETFKSKLLSSESYDADSSIEFKLDKTFVYQDLNISINLNPSLLSASIDKNGNLVFYPNFTLENINGSIRNSDYMQSVFEQFLIKLHDANISCEDGGTLVNHDQNLSNFTNLSTNFDIIEISRIYNETDQISRQDQQQLKNIYQYFRNILENPTRILQVKQGQADRLQAIISLTKFPSLQSSINSSGNYSIDIILFNNEARYQSSLTIDHESFNSFFKFLEGNLALRGFFNAMKQQGDGVITNLASNHHSNFSLSNKDDFREILPFDKFLLEMTKQLSTRYGMGQERFALILQYSEVSNSDLHNQSIKDWFKTCQNIKPTPIGSRSSFDYIETTSPFVPTNFFTTNPYIPISSSSEIQSNSTLQTTSYLSPLQSSLQSSSYAQNTNTTKTVDSSDLSSTYFKSVETPDFSTPLPEDKASSPITATFFSESTLAPQTPAINATNNSVHIKPANITSSQTSLSRDPNSYLDIFRRQLQRDILCIELPSTTARAVSMILSSYSSLDKTQQESVNSIVEQLSRFIAVAVVRSPESAGVGLAVGQLISSGQKIPQIKEYVENFEQFKDSPAVKCLNDSWEKIPAIVRNFSTHLAFASVYYLAISGYESLTQDSELDPDHRGNSDLSRQVLYATLISISSSAMNAVARYVGDKFSKKDNEVGEEEVDSTDGVRAVIEYATAQGQSGREESGGVEISSAPIPGIVENLEGRVSPQPRASSSKALVVIEKKRTTLI
jgi:hypothetical protein